LREVMRILVHAHHAVRNFRGHSVALNS
jgi:hypothetical protein